MIENKYNFKSTDNLNLFVRSWQASEKPAAVICLIHGLGEHSGRYSNLAEYFVKKNISVLAMDLRGHGLSDGKRGHTPNYECLLEDIKQLINKAKELYPDCPIILYGHSMGGTLALSYSQSYYKDIKLLISTSPWLRLSFAPSKIKILLATLFSSLLPSLIQKTGLNPLHLSKNKVIVEQYTNDVLVHDKISVSTYLSIFNAGSNLMKSKDIKIPCAILHGNEDKICSWQASSEFAGNNKNFVEYKLWDGLYHELHNEDIHVEIYDYIYNWISKSLTN
ncbi:alpha/beta hydrolase [Bacteroidota bacterium]